VAEAEAGEPVRQQEDQVTRTSAEAVKTEQDLMEKILRIKKTEAAAVEAAAGVLRD
jgi:hypothetical protein